MSHRIGKLEQKAISCLCKIGAFIRRTILFLFGRFQADVCFCGSLLIFHEGSPGLPKSEIVAIGPEHRMVAFF